MFVKCFLQQRYNYLISGQNAKEGDNVQQWFQYTRWIGVAADDAARKNRFKLYAKREIWNARHCIIIVCCWMLASHLLWSMLQCLHSCSAAEWSKQNRPQQNVNTVKYVWRRWFDRSVFGHFIPFLFICCCDGIRRSAVFGSMPFSSFSFSLMQRALFQPFLLFCCRVCRFEANKIPNANMAEYCVQWSRFEHQFLQ